MEHRGEVHCRSILPIAVGEVIPPAWGKPYEGQSKVAGLIVWWVKMHNFLCIHTTYSRNPVSDARLKMDSGLLPKPNLLVLVLKGNLQDGLRFVKLPACAFKFLLSCL